MAVGCGWQTFVAYVNIGCYYIVGVPLGALLGFYFKLGAKVISPFSVNILHNQISSLSLNIIEKINNIILVHTGNMVRNAGRYSDANNHFNMDHRSN